MMPVSIDEATHVYTRTATGERLPSVTQIIHEVFQVQGWGYNQDTADRGEAVHHMCRLISAGDTEIEDRAELVWERAADPERENIAPYGRAWRRFVTEMGYVSEHWEQPLASSLGFAGRPDTWGVIGSDRAPVLVDIKTGSLRNHVGVQLAAYAALLKENCLVTGPMKRRAVLLEWDGSHTCASGIHVKEFGWIDFDNSYWDTLWNSALNCFRSGLIKTQWSQGIVQKEDS